MTIKCPHCGEICEVDSEILVGQHIECPFCAHKFHYSGNADNLEANAAITTPEMQEKGIRFCCHCGAKIFATASFCHRCGRKVLAEGHKTTVEATAEAVSSDVEPVLETKISMSEKFDKLVRFIWLSLILSAISAIISCIDVREFFDLGRTGTFVYCAAFLGIKVWLYIVVMRRKSWARKSFIVMSLLEAFLFILGLQSGRENFIVTILDIADLLISLYCVYLCFTKEVVAVFKPDSELRDARAVVNTIHCFGYWLVLGVINVIAIVFGWCHYGTKDWVRDCREAAVAGSSSAREDLIIFEAEQIDQDFGDPTEIATKRVDAYIRNKNAKDEETNSRKTSNSRPPTSAMYWGGKILGKIVVGLAVLIGGVYSKFKDLISKLTKE